MGVTDYTKEKVMEVKENKKTGTHMSKINHKPPYCFNQALEIIQKKSKKIKKKQVPTCPKETAPMPQSSSGTCGLNRKTERDWCRKERLPRSNRAPIVRCPNRGKPKGLTNQGIEEEKTNVSPP